LALALKEMKRRLGNGLGERSPLVDYQRDLKGVIDV
jgi:hypothetical protein